MNKEQFDYLPDHHDYGGFNLYLGDRKIGICAYEDDAREIKQQRINSLAPVNKLLLDFSRKTINALRDRVKVLTKLIEKGLQLIYTQDAMLTNRDQRLAELAEALKPFAEIYCPEMDVYGYAGRDTKDDMVNRWIRVRYFKHAHEVLNKKGDTHEPQQ